MNITFLRDRRGTTFPGGIVAKSVLLGFAFAITISAQSQAQQPKASTSPVAVQTTKAQIAKTREAWHKSLVALPHPKPGCYKASFPRVEWIPVTCGTPPRHPALPAHGMARPFVVGGGGANDFSSHPTGTISGVDGTFTSVSAGITESGPIANSGPAVSNAYTLQINTDNFSSTACAGSPNPNCKGWEQFVYENNDVTHGGYIQYWLIKYNATCPSIAWTQFSFTTTSDIYCYQSTGTSSLMAGHPVSDLSTMTMSASVTAASDQLVITAGGDSAMVMGLNAVNVAAGWTDAEFNVFGDGGNDTGGGQAGFGANSTIGVKNTVHNGTRNAPGCSLESFTGETNNLTLVGMAPIATMTSPDIEFTESNVPGSVASCATAGGIGDTHLTTFGGLLYDFQAAGDFVLAQNDKDFVVETRQVSGAPTWPNATVNKAVATQMGKTRVAFCTAPSRLAVDGDVTQVGDGQTMSLPSGVSILRTGNIYVVVDQNGNSMRAEDNGSYVNVSVGLGRWPDTVRGVLANVRGNAKQIETRTGTVFTSPFSFDALYHQFADSWRVPESESLLGVCGERVETGIPQKTFTSANLAPEVAKRAQAVCARAGVKVKSLLDACTLDVAVIGQENAAKAFVGVRAPAVVGGITPSRARNSPY
jgi:von Willebrand factor type D domain